MIDLKAWIQYQFIQYNYLHYTCKTTYKSNQWFDEIGGVIATAFKFQNKFVAHEEILECFIIHGKYSEVNIWRDYVKVAFTVFLPFY